MTADRHAVFAALTSGTRIRVTPWTDWHDAQARWDTLDTIRRDHLHDPAANTNVAWFAVRHEDDPDWSDVDLAPSTVMLTVGKGAKDYKAPTRRVGAEHGLTGREGGWIYDADGNPVEQGWWTFFDRYRKRGEIVLRGVGHGTRYFVNEYRHALRTPKKVSA